MIEQRRRWRGIDKEMVLLREQLETEILEESLPISFHT